MITCYTFDFLFFEERILPALRRSNIKNIVVFADGNFLERVLDNKTGREFASSRTYALSSIYSKNIFHPKMMLMVGKQQGLLLTGSGNLTASGLSCNDEIWGAFHLNDLEIPHALIFGQAWAYLQKNFNQVQGFNRTQLNWFSKYAPWLNQLPNPADNSFCLLPNGDEALFLSNGQKTVSHRVFEIIPPGAVAEITVISPYYDQDGRALLALQNYFQPQRINCLADIHSGLLPDQLLPTGGAINFYSWSECITDFNSSTNRLHAKAFHFLLNDGSQYLLLGSANATAPGLGIDGAVYMNEEACILLRRKTGKLYLNDLGITIKPEAAFDPATFKRVEISTSSGISHRGNQLRILHVELMANELMLYLKLPEKKLPPESISIQVQDHWDETIAILALPIGQNIQNYFT
ncbi:MAG: hypothetical protein IPM36_17090 [Lewinellaceae bacterium]|nr:hypothetical protein [Lewinellaceae bacterium]